MRHFPEPDPGRPSVGSARAYVLWLAGRHRAPALLATLYGVVCTLAQALVPATVGVAIDQGLVDRDRRALVLWSAAVLGLGIVQAISGTLRDRCSLTNRLGGAYRTMQLVTAKAVDLGAELPRRVSSGSVVSVGATDIAQIGAALESTARGGGAVVSIVAVAVLMLTASWQLGLVALVGVPLIAWAVTRLMRLLHDRQHDLRDQQGALTDLSVDIVEGLRVLRGIGGEDVFAARYRERSQRVRQEAVRVASVEALAALGRTLLPGLLTTAIVWLGAHYVGTGRLGPGDLVAFYGYAVFLAEQLRRATTTVDQLTRALVSARRVVEFLALERTTPSGDRALATEGDLHDPDAGLTVPDGRFVAVVCAESGDAHRLADRLGGYLPAPVTYGDVPLAAAPPDEVRGRILVVDHAFRLFSGRLGRELDPDGRLTDDAGRLERVLDTASARDIVDALPDGLDHEGSGGREFSGGEQQRLHLARALIRDPKVLILVDPTSALDAHTEGRIADRLGAYREGRTTLLFTTSPLLLDRAELVLYVEDGRVTARGSHDELLADARYRAVVTREVAVA
ncbi:ABC transporter transmembrane domain-containing protein [Streptomyces sp. S465]|uniref:ABC transporter transmembrane domain-containing protein n=1 Tax=Streptomyces sp. S465 TaxID=2979468 RepID=UPI0022A8429C|nr:ABC transporter ATP-binding protein [Streptomyces sp. S465]WAP60389.1 ABC transporter ATP-binding protein [Streptomyces sp. S465]